MGKGALVIFVVIAGFLAAASSAYAQSLLKKSNTTPYDEPVGKIYKKHDHIQIQVVEKSKASVGADFRGDKRSRTEMGLKDWIKFKTDKHGFQFAPPGNDVEPEINMDARYRQDNIGRTSRQLDLQFTVTAEIVDIRPNGVLVIEAKKERKVNSETETIKLTGEVSADSIVNNMIRSDKIANLNISYDGKGSVGDTEKPGLLGQLLGWLWPF